MVAAAGDFCIAESSVADSELYGVTDGKKVGTYVEHRFQDYLKTKYDVLVGNSAKGIVP